MNIKLWIWRTLHWYSVFVNEICSQRRAMERCIVLKKRIDELTQFSLHTTELGISKDRICKEEVVVSLTSYGTRFYDCYLAVESIMQGSVKPNRIVLWVSDTLKNETVPILLQNQVKRGLEIRYRRDIRSYTK